MNIQRIKKKFFPKFVAKGKELDYRDFSRQVNLIASGIPLTILINIAGKRITQIQG